MSNPVSGAVETTGVVELHRASFDLADFPTPNGREEDWRFTPLDRFRGLLEAPATSGGHLKWTTDLPEGVVLTSVGADDPLRRQVPKPVDRVGALAYAHSDGAVVVRVPAEAELDAPVTIRLDGEPGPDGLPQLVHGHTIVEVGAHAQATIVLEHHGSARYASEVSVLVGDGARVQLASLQLWADDAVHLGHVGIRVGRDATVHSTQVSLGGDVVRVVETAEFAGPGGNVDLNGVYIADAGQHIEHRLFVDHAVPNCRSNVTYKGALQGDRAHTVWVGDVLIRAAAEGTDTYELNRNLILTDGARADSVPNLEIETGEIVGAGHASATGRFDDEQLFYLQARGIPEAEARRLVVRGFFADLVAKIGVPAVQDRLMAEIEKELDMEVSES
ncbi:Fe-S cluster assembly protein SufD [Spongisporangium articulatum]|uniref:Fe-S cluster assembly protein SufD n=1 Tax=Spongisporangium articulatum TaxID=3362603 RepID=A0ABW8ASD4_9ACTN